jgi:hypothetical protein
MTHTIWAYSGQKFRYVRVMDGRAQAIKQAVKSMRSHGVNRVWVEVADRVVWRKG